MQSRAKGGSQKCRLWGVARVASALKYTSKQKATANQCTLLSLVANGMILSPFQSWLTLQTSSVRDEVALNIAAATLWQTKLIVAARFGNSYGRLVQLLSSPNVVVRNDVGA